MPDINEIHPYNFPASQASDFDRKGHPGKWKTSLSLSGTVWFTGSNYGYGGILPAGSPSGTAYLSAGGTVDLSILQVGKICELSLEHVENAANVYALLKNHVIR